MPELSVGSVRIGGGIGVGGRACVRVCNSLCSTCTYSHVVGIGSGAGAGAGAGAGTGTVASASAHTDAGVCSLFGGARARGSGGDEDRDGGRGCSGAR